MWQHRRTEADGRPTQRRTGVMIYAAIGAQGKMRFFNKWIECSHGEKAKLDPDHTP